MVRMHGKAPRTTQPRSNKLWFNCVDESLHKETLRITLQIMHQNVFWLAPMALRPSIARLHPDEKVRRYFMGNRRRVIWLMTLGVRT